MKEKPYYRFAVLKKYQKDFSKEISQSSKYDDWVMTAMPVLNDHSKQKIWITRLREKLN